MLAAAAQSLQLYVDENKQYLLAVNGAQIFQFSYDNPHDTPKVIHFPGEVIQYSQGSVVCALWGEDGRQQLQLYGIDGHSMSAKLVLEKSERCEQVILNGRRAILTTTTLKQTSPQDGHHIALSTDRQYAVSFLEGAVKAQSLSVNQNVSLFEVDGNFYLRDREVWLLTYEGEEPVPLGEPHRQLIQALSLEDVTSFNLSIEAEPEDFRGFGLDPSHKRVLLATSTAIRIIPLQ